MSERYLSLYLEVSFVYPHHLILILPMKASQLMDVSSVLLESYAPQWEQIWITLNSINSYKTALRLTKVFRKHTERNYAQILEQHPMSI